MRQVVDLTGQVFGMLTVTGMAINRNDGQGNRWNCKCECGNTHESRGNVLKLGNVKSCGCMRAIKGKPTHGEYDMVGRRAGSLVVIKKAGRDNNGKQLWSCVCDCGGEAVARGTDIRAGNTKSCGCLRNKGRDITGMKFGKLTAIKSLMAGSGKSTIHDWECYCDCGSTHVVPLNALTQGNTKSCGCLKRPKKTAP